MLNTIKLNGADAQATADLIGGTLIMVDLTNDEAMISGGDITKLIQKEIVSV